MVRRPRAHDPPPPFPPSLVPTAPAALCSVQAPPKPRKRTKTEGGLDGVKTQEEIVAEAEAKVQADLQRLLGGGRFGSEAVDEREEDEDNMTDLTGGPGWSAPQGQTGDGRTSLNTKFGY